MEHSRWWNIHFNFALLKFILLFLAHFTPIN